MSWVSVSDTLKVRCIQKIKKADKKYCYEYVFDDGEVIPSETNTNPLSLSSNNEVFKIIKVHLEDIIKNEKAKLIGVSINNIKKELYENELAIRLGSVKKELKDNIILEEDLIQKESSQSQQDIEKEIDKKYRRLYSKFQVYCEEDGYTPLREVISISHCLGVGNPREIVRAWLGYMQTYLGFKASNVIAVGSPASGKSFILETALSMIPSERIHTGIPSVAYFFRKFNGMDLTGHIFFLGDLGGEKDNEETIALRDVLKQLTTDGYVERGIINTEDMSEEAQWVKGYPCLSYSTANESIINDQEKSRSIILTPEDPDYRDMVVFKSIMENKGDFTEPLHIVDKKRESVKGLVHQMVDEEFDFFNPYLYIVAEFLKENYDFNRKIDEYNAILKLVTMLDEPYITDYSITMINDDEDEVTSTRKLYLSRRKHNRDSLKIFNTSNLLPDEVAFGNGILKKIPRMEKDFLETVKNGEYILWDLINKDKSNVENHLVRFINTANSIDKTMDLTEKIVLSSNGEFVKINQYLFTKKSLKNKFRNNKWYSKSRDYIDNRIKLLVDEGVILKVGKSTDGFNVFCINPFQETLLGDEKLDFKSEDIKDGVELFKQNYSNVFDEFCDFINNDDSVEESGIFEAVKPVVLGLPFNKE